jgi:amidase
MNPFASAVDMLAALRGGEVSSAELVERHIARIERYDEKVNAVVVRDFDRARRQAATTDSARSRGEDRPLLGLPMTVKDCLHVAGLPTTGGVVERANAVAGQDSVVVSRVRAAGAVIMGKTNVPPYAADVQSWNPLFGRTSNPWHPGRTPGGSSGGAAAAVAAGLTALELGGDLAGSIRQPAAFCGVYGHKPSESAVPRSGHFPAGPLPNPAIGMGVQGPLARSAADLALAMTVIAGPEPGESAGWQISLPPARHARLRDFRVAFLPCPDWLPVDDEILAAADHLADALAAAGATVAVRQPACLDDFHSYHGTYLRLFHAITATEPRARRPWLARCLRAAGDEHAIAHADALLGTADDYIGWCAAREGYRASFAEFFRDWDVLIAPNHCVNAFPHDPRPHHERDLLINGSLVGPQVEMVHPGLANLSGHPATAFPAGTSREGLPIGLQAIGPYLGDRTSIEFAGLVAGLVDGFRPPPGYT